MKTEGQIGSILRGITHFFTFFLLIAFVITCCTTLFVTTLAKTLDITLAGEQLGSAARITFLNVILLSVFMTVIDTLRRKITVERPVKQITVATEKIVHGDFSVRIKPQSKFTTDEKFNQVTYSAKEQEEVKAIRKKYTAPEEKEDKMAQLRRLDASVTQKATAAALVFGIIGALLLGFGMSLAMTELSETLGALRSMAMLVGIAVGIIGIVLVCLAYPIYNRIVKKEREKIAPEIIRLTDELMK